LQQPGKPASKKFSRDGQKTGKLLWFDYDKNGKLKLAESEKQQDSRKLVALFAPKWPAGCPFSLRLQDPHGHFPFA
jgi:hypothetical protein